MRIALAKLPPESTLRPMFYLAINRVPTGPLSEAEVRQRIAAGQVGPADLCWQEGWPEWRKVADVFAPAVPPLLADAPPPLPGAQPAAPAPVAPVAAPGGKATSGWAVASFVCGLGVFVLFPFFLLLAPAAIVCGHLAKAKIARAGGQLVGRGLAIAGLLLGYGGGGLLLAASTAIGVYAYRSWHQETEDTAVRSHLSLLWSACEQKMLESGATSVAYDEVVGPDKTLAESDLAPVAGEDYRGLTVHQGDESLAVTLQDGRTVEYYASSPAGAPAVESEPEEENTDNNSEASEPDAPEEQEAAPSDSETPSPAEAPAPATEPEAFLGAPAAG